MHPDITLTLYYSSRTHSVVMKNAFLNQAKWSICLWNFQKLLALRLCTSPWNLFNYHTTLTLLTQTECIVPQTKGSPTVCYQNSTEKQREVEESIFHLSERHITVRLSYNTSCGKLFLTWLTLNEASDEKKMLFSPHSWARNGFAMSYVFVCLCVCVHVCVLFSVRDYFHTTKTVSLLSYQFISYTCTI